MSACRPAVSFSLVCLCSVALGCVTQQTKTDGSFVTGGPGKYGQPAPNSQSPLITNKTDLNYKPSPRLKLAAAQFQEQRGYRDEARQTYHEVLASDSKSVEAVIGLARLDQVAGRTADAEAGFQKAMRMDPKSGRALDALGQYYADQKRWNDALPLLQRAMEATPQDKVIRFHYGVVLAKSGQISQAFPMLVDSVGPAAAHYNVGLVLHERGDLAASRDQFVAAIVENPRLEQAQYWLNEVNRQMDQASAVVPVENREVTDRGPRW
jgi:tetratricopeptide (TPR) repeat protein